MLRDGGQRQFERLEGGERGRLRCVDQTFGHLDGTGIGFGEFPGDGLGPLDRGPGGGYLVDQAELQRLLGAEALTTQQECCGPVPAELLGQPPRQAAVGNDGPRHERRGEELTG